MDQNNRVFITGRSVVSAAGNTADTTWESILNGSTGIAEMTHDDISSWPCKLAGELKDYQPNKMLPDRKLVKVISRQDVIGIHAAVQAVEHSQILLYRNQLNNCDLYNEETAVFVGSPGNKYFQQYDFLPLISRSQADMKAFASHLFDEVHPTWLLRILPNNVLAYTGITYGFKGPNHNMTNHAVGGTQALLEAYHAIKSGQAERAIVVAYDYAIEPQSLFYYHQLGVLSTQHLKPFDKQHDGTIMAEGAAALVLESEASVKARSAVCYAELLGGLAGSESEGLFSLEKSGSKLSQLINNTMHSSHVSIQDIGLLVAHGNGTIHSDNSESQAITKVFQDKTPPVTAFKWSVGHTVCASGLMDVVMATYALKTRCAPGIANLDRKADESVGLALSAEHQDIHSNCALVINRGFASMNSCVVIKDCE